MATSQTYRLKDDASYVYLAQSLALALVTQLLTSDLLKEIGIIGLDTIYN